jgi:hypothetical protein
MANRRKAFSLMRWVPWGAVAVLVAASALGTLSGQVKEGPAMSMTITSSAFVNGAKIPHRYSGEGDDVSPPLKFQGIPADAQELALICDDPNAPSPEPWVHWVLYGLSPQTKELPEGISSAANARLPEGAQQGKNSWKAIGYRGPLPPPRHGVHHYHFKLYALDRKLDLKPGLDKSAVLKAIQGHVLAEGELIGLYERK